LDCSGLSRCGKVARLAGDKPTLNIDHHISNCRFADVNWVDSGASSACEMTYSLYKAMRQPINKEAALSLYTGIFTDTGSFRYPNTSAFTHRAAADLLRYKLDVARVYKKTYEDIPFACVGVLNKVLATVKRDASGRIAWLYLEKRLYQNLAAGFDLTDYILGIARAIKGIEVAALFRESLERPGYVRVNLRSQGKVDVNRIASSFGGGGHRTASGCTVKGSLVSVSNAVIREICRFLK